MLEWGTYPGRGDLAEGAFADIAVAFFTLDPLRGPMIRNFGVRGFWVWRERREGVR